MLRLTLLTLLAAVAHATVHFKEDFGSGWDSRWVESTFKGAEQGKFRWTAGAFYGDAEADKGIQTSTDARFYGISAKFDSFSNEGKELVIQFTVKFEQSIDCGGGYVKLYPSGITQSQLHGDTPYHIMFGPDICGPGTRKVHVIFAYKGRNLLTKKEIRCKDDVYTHLYTLRVKPDNTYEVYIDNEKAESGTLEDDWDFLPPKRIRDPNVQKPPQSEWDEREKIDDESATKPDDWEKPQFIPDPNAKKPEDWDDEMDGEWEPPQIENPEYKGEWKPPQIDNPNYKGPWQHPEIDNPEYSADPNLYRYTDIGAIGVDVWQVKSGTIFDNILVADSLEDARAHAKETWERTKDGEKKMKEAQDAEAAKKAEEESKKQSESKSEETVEDNEEDEEEKTGHEGHSHDDL
jgi:calreticulin